MVMNDKCPKCGHEIQSGDDFCTNCGYKLKHDNKKSSIEQPRSNDDQNSTKRKPIQKMKVLEDSSSDLRKEQVQEVWKKKQFWFVIALIAIVVLIVKANVLPKGYSNCNDVMEYCMKRSFMLNSFQNTRSIGGELADAFGYDNDDENFMLLENKKTKRYVFRYSYDGEYIPSYVIASKGPDDKYIIDIIPVKKGHIASISKYDVSEEYMDKHFPSDEYVGYSNNDIYDMNTSLDKNVSKPNTSGKTWVSYDKSEEE